MPGVDHTVELQDLHLEHPQLGAERGDTRACNFGHPFVTWIGDDPEQFLDAIAADRRDDSELCKMGTDRIDHGGLLADEEMAGAMKHQAALLLGCLGRDMRPAPRSSETRCRPSFLRTTPAKKPRTECACQWVVFMMAAIVAP